MTGTPPSAPGNFRVPFHKLTRPPALPLPRQPYSKPVDLLVVVVLDLHHLVAGREGPAEPLHLALAGRIDLTAAKLNPDNRKSSS